MTIREQVEKVINRYYIEDEERYASYRPDDEGYTISIEEELKRFFKPKLLNYKIKKEYGFDNAGIDTYYLVVAFVNEPIVSGVQGELELITVYLEDC